MSDRFLAFAGPIDCGVVDLAKAAWYSQMAAHVIDPENYNDPRKLPNTQKK